MTKRVKLAVLLLLSAAGYVFPQRCYAQAFELPCVAGASPMEAPTFNPNTQKLRAWLCVDSLGNVTSPVFGAAGSGVTSFNARTGAVLPAANDYSFAQLSGVLSTAQVPTGGSATSFLNGAGTYTTPTGVVTSVFGRTGAVVAAANDYGSVVGLTLGDVSGNSIVFAGALGLTLTGTDTSNISIGAPGVIVQSNNEFTIADQFNQRLQATTNGIQLQDNSGDGVNVFKANNTVCLNYGSAACSGPPPNNSLIITGPVTTGQLCVNFGNGPCSTATSPSLLMTGSGGFSWNATNSALTTAGGLTVVTITPTTIAGAANFSGTPTFAAGAGLGTGTFSGSATFSGATITFSGATINASTAVVEASVGTATTCGLCLGAATSNGLAESNANAVDTIANGTATLRVQSGFIKVGSGAVFAFTSGAVTNAVDTNLGRLSAGVAELASSATAGTTGKLALSAELVEGTKFTLSANACAATTLVGGGSAGSINSGTTGTCTFTVTFGDTATSPNGWSCYASDQTTIADLIHQTGSTTTTASFSGTTVSADVINFSCRGY